MRNLNIILPEYVKEAFAVMKKSFPNSSSYIVGGCVRDSLLNKEPNDYDITTSLTPEEIKKAFSKYSIINTNGEQHGTVTVRISNTNVEITTFRIDSTYSDMRHPDKVEFTDNLKLDLSRRDFTINAMAYNDDSGIVDYFDGESDLKNKIIRCVGEPEKRFTEDALRILRMLRFASKLSFSIDTDTINAAYDKRLNLSVISAERVQSELNKMIVEKSFMTLLKDTRVLEIILTIIPELRDCVDFNQHNPYHKHDVLTHSLAVLNFLYLHHYSKLTSDLCLAALLHDIGKPHCYQVDEIDSTLHYHYKGHGEVSAEIVDKILTRLKYSNLEKSKILWLVRQHDYDVALSKKSIVKFLKTIPADLDKNVMFFNWIALRNADRQDHIYTEKDKLKMVDLSELWNYYLSLKTKHEEVFNVKDLKINGYDLLALGLKGKALGDMLDKLVELVLEGTLENKKELLLKYVVENK